MIKFLPLLLSSLGRKKTRTILTIGSFAVALFLYAILTAVQASFDSAVAAGGADRLVVMNRTSFIVPLPYAYRDRIAKVPGLVTNGLGVWFGGVYQDPKNFFAQFAIDPATWRDLYSEFVVPPDQWEAFLQTKSGAIVGQSTARRFGWKVGDRIPMQGGIFPGLWEFDLVGIYTGTREFDDLTQFWFRYDYLKDKAGGDMANMVGWYIVKLKNIDDTVKVSKEIDDMFANSPYETRTLTERALNQSFIKAMGNVKFLLITIGAVVFFTLLLVTGNTIAASVRERTGELAVLKAVGFSDDFVLRLVFLESVLVAAIGGGLGLLAGHLFTLRGDPTGFFPAFYIPVQGFILGAILIIATGLVAAVIPAFGARRLSVIEALRRL
jgi:putative ABC transport system permease protein